MHLKTFTWNIKLKKTKFWDKVFTWIKKKNIEEMVKFDYFEGQKQKVKANV